MPASSRGIEVFDPIEEAGEADAGDPEHSKTFSFWADRATNPSMAGTWMPVIVGVTKTSRVTRPLTARLQEPKVSAEGDCVLAGFDQKEDFDEKVSKDKKTSNLFVYRQDMAQREREKRGEYVGICRGGEVGMQVVDMQTSFFKKLGRDKGFTITSPVMDRRSAAHVQASKESILSSSSTVQHQMSGEEAPELMQEISQFERTHLAGHAELFRQKPQARPWRQGMVPSKREIAIKGVEELETDRRKMSVLPHHVKKGLTDEAKNLLQRHPSLLELELDTLQDQGLNQSTTTPVQNSASNMIGLLDCAGLSGDTHGRVCKMGKSPLSPLPAAAMATITSPRSPRAPRRDLPGTWDAQHPDAIDHEKLAFTSGAVTDRTFNAHKGEIKYDPLNTHRAHGFEVGSPQSPITDVTAHGRNAQWTRQYGQGSWQGGKRAAIAPFYQSYQVYSSARLSTDKLHVEAALARRELLEEPMSGMGQDPNANIPIGPLHGRKRPWNFRYDMTHNETISRAFDLDTSPYGGADTKIWATCVTRSGVDQNRPGVWPGMVSADREIQGSRRNQVLPQGHSGDFRSTLVKMPDGTVKHRPLSSHTKGKIQTSLFVQGSKDYILEHRQISKGGRYFDHELALPASPSSPGPWQPPPRKIGAGWGQGVMAQASNLPANRSEMAKQQVPAWRSVASLMREHDHRGLDETSVAVQWQPYKRDRGPMHEATLWDHYLTPPGMKMFVSVVCVRACVWMYIHIYIYV